MTRAGGLLSESGLARSLGALAEGSRPERRIPAVVVPRWAGREFVAPKRVRVRPYGEREREQQRRFREADKKKIAEKSAQRYRALKGRGVDVHRLREPASLAAAALRLRWRMPESSNGDWR